MGDGTIAAVVAISGTALAGLTTFAYRDHAAYVRLARILTPLIAVVLLGIVVWDASGSHALNALLDYIPAGKRAEARSVVEGFQIGRAWVFVPILAAAAYLQFLSIVLPRLMDGANDLDD